MASSPLNKLYDPIRKEWVKETPEEQIRQQWLKVMLEELGYPLALLAVEKELRHLPHLKLTKGVPKRRIDIVAFAKGVHPHFSLFPLLLMECKSEPLNPIFARQVIGYNGAVQAPFVALANRSQVLTGSFDRSAGLFRFSEGLPSYRSLLSQISKEKCSTST